MFPTFDPWLALQISLQILLAFSLGALIGLERERHRQPAGIRTHALVSAGSCMFTILSYRGFPGGDPARVAAQIVTGIGFLGAGVLVQRKGTIYGLTSAAGIWAVAAVGMAVGAGNYYLAVFGDLTIFVVLGLLRRWLKADVVRSTRRTLRTALRHIRQLLSQTGQLAADALRQAIQAALEDDHDLARQVIDGDQEINRLRYAVEDECLTILRARPGEDLQLRTVVAASHIAIDLERVGDYAKDIARARLELGHDPLPLPADRVRAIVAQLVDLLADALASFERDDVRAARDILPRASSLEAQFDELIEGITDEMGGRKLRHFGRGAHAISVTYHLKGVAERATNIAEQVVFVRTGALLELEQQD